MNYLPAPGGTSFRAPYSAIYYISPLAPVWTIIHTAQLRVMETAFHRAANQEWRYAENLKRQRVCQTPRIIYGQPPAGSLVQMRLFEEVA